MAKAKLGPHMTAISGTIGGITYVPLHGEQILRQKAKRAKRSSKQDIQPQVIQSAAAYWRKVKADPVQLAFYASLPKVPGWGLYHFAVRNYCHPPVVEEIDVSSYSGRVGNPVRIKATDDTAVKEVSVRILDMTGGLLEEGPATLGEDKANWVYISTRAVASGQSVEVSVVAKDHPGNSATKKCLAYVRS